MFRTARNKRLARGEYFARDTTLAATFSVIPFWFEFSIFIFLFFLFQVFRVETVERVYDGLELTRYK